MAQPINGSNIRLMSSYAHVKRVAVIGGGVAGLQAARSLAAHGFEPIVFERSSDVGGVWRSNYVNFGVQVPKQLYEFPDFPFAALPWGAYPTGPQTQEYIRSFARHFQLDRHVRLNTAVRALQPRADGARGWTVLTDATNSNSSASGSSSVDVDFAVVATGMYCTPNLPKYEGADAFKGRIVHSSTMTDAAAAAGKHVIVVGGGKSAADLAVELSPGAASSASSTLLFRNGHFGTPRKIAGLIPFQYVFLSRFGQALVSWYKGAFPTAPGSVHAAHKLLSPVMGPVFGLVGALFNFQLGTRGVRQPDMDVVKDFYGYAQVLDTSLKAAVASGAVAARKGEIARLTEKSVVLTDGTELPCDLLVCATGFKKDYSYLPAATRDALGLENDGLYLYRNILPPGVRDLAFIGSEVATISNIATHGLQSEYLAYVLKGRVALPEPPAMAAAVEAHKSWARGFMPRTSCRGALVLLHQVHYHDGLLRDMGIPHRRKGANVLAELFMPYQPADYNGVLTPAGPRV